MKSTFSNASRKPSPRSLNSAPPTWRARSTRYCKRAAGQDRLLARMPSAAPPATASQVQPRAPAPAGSTRHYVPLLLAWIFGAAYIWIFLLRQWVPHDEGAFADMAARILRGEVPHRDYLDLYTGGLAYLHAFAWKIFGRDLAAFRYVLYAFAL